MLFKTIIKAIFFFILHCFWFFPIKRNRIFFESYNGKQFSCNPKYIFLNLDKSKYECVWAFYGKEKDCPQSAKIVKRKGFKYFYFLLTSKIAITNVNFSSYIPFRNKQVLINTWHGGGGYKYSVFGGTKKETKKSFSKFDYFISSCSFFTDKAIFGTFFFEKKVLEIGMPRNDILFNASNLDKSIFLKYCDSIEDKSFVLYAPTYRDYKTEKGEYEEIDFGFVGEAIERRFGKKVVWIIRTHHFDTLKIENTGKIIDGRLFDDMQILLRASDILISDYSSSIWDFSIMFKPCFLFTPDISKYEGVRSFYSPINEWGFPFADCNKKLADLIDNFDENTYLSSIRNMHKKWGTFEKGTASNCVSNLIEEIVYGSKNQ